MNDALSIFTDAWEQISKSPLWVLVCIMTLAIGLTLKKLRCFDNRYIPVFLLAFSTVAYCVMGNPGKIDPDQSHPRVILAFFGFILGFVTWGAHKFLLKKLEKFLPDGFFPCGEFDSDPPFPKPDGSNVKP